jgi:hypothetical protein
VPAEAANAMAVVFCSVLNYVMADRLVFTYGAEEPVALAQP